MDRASLAASLVMAVCSAPSVMSRAASASNSMRTLRSWSSRVGGDEKALGDGRAEPAQLGDLAGAKKRGSGSEPASSSARSSGGRAWPRAQAAQYFPRVEWKYLICRRARTRRQHQGRSTPNRTAIATAGRIDDRDAFISRRASGSARDLRPVPRAGKRVPPAAGRDRDDPSRPDGKR